MRFYKYSMNDGNNEADNFLRKILSAADYNRVQQHLYEDSVCFISAFRGDVPYEENLKNHYKLGELISGLGLGYIHITGQSFETYDKDYRKGKFQPELSYLVILNNTREIEADLKKLEKELNNGKELDEEKLLEFEEKVKAIKNKNVKNVEKNIKEFEKELNTNGILEDEKLLELEEKLEELEDLKKQQAKQFFYQMMALKDKFKQTSILIRYYLGDGEFDTILIENNIPTHYRNVMTTQNLIDYWSKIHKTKFKLPRGIDTSKKQAALYPQFRLDYTYENRSISDFSGQGRGPWWERYSCLCELKEYNDNVDPGAF